MSTATDDCTKRNVLYYILPYYSEWYDIGCNLGLPSVELEKIRQHHISDQVPQLVELWDRWETLSWKKLYEALKRIIEMKAARRESTTSIEIGQQFQTLCVPALRMDEEPVIGK